MPSEDKKLKALTAKERNFVEAVVYDGMPRIDAYGLVFGVEVPDEGEERNKLLGKVTSLFAKPHIRAYYDDLMDEVRDEKKDKAKWNKEIATETMLKLIEKANAELDTDRITMARVTAITTASKELNTIHGLNAPTKLDVEGGLVVNIIEDVVPD